MPSHTQATVQLVDSVCGACEALVRGGEMPRSRA